MYSSTLQELIRFLEDRESDIAREVEDFAELRNVFEELIERTPREDC